jgi:hypothetical protein
MVRIVAFVATTALIAGCAGTPMSLQSVIPAQQTRPGIAIAVDGADRVGPKLCPKWPGGTGVLRDGDLHDAPEPPPGMSQTFWTGQGFATDWVVTHGSVDLTGNFFQLPNGVCSLDMDGLSPGAVAHRPFKTTRGSTYTVAFVFSANGASGCKHAPTIKTLKVMAAGQSETLTWDTSGGYDGNDGDYLQESWNFKATESRTTLHFASLDEPRTSTCGPVVAAVTVAGATAATR